MVDTALFSSAKSDWETPDDLFQEYDQRFGFTLDCAANQHNTKCRRWLGPGSPIAEDALVVSWAGEICWLNPPYGANETPKWVEKAFRESSQELGATVVMLLPSRTDTRWFHDYLWLYAELKFLRGRLRFKGALHPAPFPSLIAIFYPRE